MWMIKSIHGGRQTSREPDLESTSYFVLIPRISKERDSNFYQISKIGFLNTSSDYD